MIRELSANQVVVVSGGSAGQAAEEGFVAGAAGLLTDQGVKGIAVRIGLGAARGALMGGLAGVVVGIGIAVAFEILDGDD